ncbi:hypothetical protein [Tomitella cavernea]
MADDEAMPDETMPEFVAARLRRALVAEPAPGHAPARSADESMEGIPAAARVPAPRGRRMIAAAAAVAAIGAAVGGSALWLTAGPDNTNGSVTAHSDPIDGTSHARDTTVDGRSGEGAVDATLDDAGKHRDSGDVDSGALLRMQGSTDLGPFAEPAALHRCLAANGLPADARILGEARSTWTAARAPCSSFPARIPPC